MKTLFVLNDPPYGTERSYNALRLASALSGREGEEVRVFLTGDAASCSKSGQKVPTRSLANGLPAVTVVNGQKALTLVGLVGRGPPGVRCNNNMQIAAEFANIYRIPVRIIPVSFAGPGAKAP